jgi:hypothetical protein
MPSNMSFPAHRLSYEDSSRGFDKRRGRPSSSGRLTLVGVGALSLLAGAALLWIYSVRAGSESVEESGSRFPAKARRVPHASEGRGVPSVVPALPAPAAAAAAAAAPEGAAGLPLPPADGRTRNIVLYTAATRINTGVWPNWGGDPPLSAVLNWAAAGTEVVKTCPVRCAFWHDDAKIPVADVVVVEGVNWPKFGYAGQPLPLPARARPNARAGSVPGAPAALPALAYFGYEPSSYFPEYSLANKELAKDFTFSMTPAGATALPFDLPITLVCPWGHAVADFLRPAPPKADASRLVAYFSEHGVAPAFRDMLDQLLAAAGERVHAFVHRRNRELPAEAGGDPFTLRQRVAFMGTYRFVLMSEAVDEPDFISAEWSQALLAGAVPVYLGGPPNLAEFAMPGGYVDARTFADGAALWAYLAAFDAAAPGADDAYAHFFDWKAAARAAHTADGPSIDALGTGAGVPDDACAPEAVRAVAEWPRPAVPGEAQPADTGFEAAAAAGWRCFRRALDRCVHYAECRACTLAHQIT